MLICCLLILSCKFFLSGTEEPVYHPHWDDIRVLKILGLVFLALGTAFFLFSPSESPLTALLVFYVLIAIWKSDSSNSPDLQSQSTLTRYIRFCAALCSRRRKVKGY